MLDDIKNKVKNTISDTVSSVFKKKRFSDMELKSIRDARHCVGTKTAGTLLLIGTFAMAMFSIAAETTAQLITFLAVAGGLAVSGANLLHKSKSRRKKWDKYDALINMNGNTSLKYLSKKMKLPPERVVSDVQEMISKHFLIGPNANLEPYIDMQSGYLIMTDYETGMPLEPVEVTAMKQESAKQRANESESIKIIRRAIIEINDADVQATLFDMASMIGKIESKIKQNPEMMSLESVEKYYQLHLPKALELVEKYRLQDGNEEAMQHIREALPVCVEAFRNMADRLYQADNDETIIDIDVMKAQLERDGLLDSDFDIKRDFDNLN